MKKLKDILYKAGLVEVVGSTDIDVASICFDSRKVEKGSLFIAVKGIQSDGHKFISQAISSGAIAIVCEEIPTPLSTGRGAVGEATYIKVSDSESALGIIASNFYDNPSEKLKLVGITGTNGKTTITSLLYKLFVSLGFGAGLISTVEYKITPPQKVLPKGEDLGGASFPATHTTPDPIQLNRLMNQMMAEGCTYCFMEVSSHAVVQKRISGLKFIGGVFTNITHDHLDYHKTFEEYLKAKKKFFDGLENGAFALVNKDDQNGMVMLQNTNATKKTYALKSSADFKCKIMESQFAGMLLNMDGSEMWTKLIGNFNASNVLAVYATAIILGQEKLKVLTALSALSSVDGRFQQIKSHSGIVGIVDYAHTPDALLNVLKTIREIRMNEEKIITVVGCGGDRDALKRPVMAQIACDESDKVILTSDNPRSEDADEIIRQMQKGVDRTQQKKVLSITDRREAIKTACSLASGGDIILVAGKGHEKYQEIKGVKHPFDDVKILIENLEMFAG
ncbi:MAG: UDP-N-acetylmuramoyl-L-alanyl-D-glutamate--2,6-diaminopimelate ligase [Bacteroidetes bacterium]|nr:UDP-N-acetylmuramoyl-L-alanyl-D-glutamate--2,6-diaminopimelate ligase [Bacteroidota bacterium]